jgi:hypothetical protein
MDGHVHAPETFLLLAVDVAATACAAALPSGG